MSKGRTDGIEEMSGQCDVCDGSGDVWIYQGEGDFIEIPCDACPAPSSDSEQMGSKK